MLITLFCFNNHLVAGNRLLYREKHNINTVNKLICSRSHFVKSGKKVVGGTAKIATNFSAPTISYASPQYYLVGNPIAPLVPVSSGVAAAAYSGMATPFVGSLTHPRGITTDAAGNIFISDFGTSLIKEYPAGGGATFTIGSGFNSPDGVAVDGQENVYVSDYSNGLVKKVASGTNIITSIGTGYSSPYGVAADAAGNVYVADYLNAAVRKIPADGGATVLIGSGFISPAGVAVDANGNVFVADFGASAIKEIPVGGGAPITLGSGFLNPYGVTVDHLGNVFVADFGHSALKEIPVGGGAVITIATGFITLTGVALDNTGMIYTADYDNTTVESFKPVGGYYVSPALPAGLRIDNSTGIISGTPTKVTAAAYYTVTAYNSSGNASFKIIIGVDAVSLSYTSPQTYTKGAAITPLVPVNASVAAPAYNNSPTLLSTISLPYHSIIDGAGNLYITSAHLAYVTKLPKGGVATPVSGSTSPNPCGLALDGIGNLYITDLVNNSVVKMPAAGGTEVTIGSGFSAPQGIAVDGAGNIYIADTGNSLVKEIPTGSNVPIVIGSGFNHPYDVAVDAFGNVYVADQGHQLVKKIPAGGGAVITLAPGFTFSFITGVSVDVEGNVFVADSSTPGGVVEIPASGATPLLIGSGFHSPEGVSVDGVGNVYVADLQNNAVKQISPVGGFFINATPPGLNFNNATGILSGTPTAVSPNTNYIVTAYNGSGSNQAQLTIKVNALAFSYSGSQNYTLNTAVTPLVPSVAGTIAAPGYSASPVITNSINKPYDVAVDALNNVYVISQTSFTVTKFPAGGGAPVSLGSGLTTPSGLAVDAAGNIYVADYGNNAIKKIPVGNGTPVTLGSGFITPFAVAVDAGGNIYVADTGNNLIKEIPAGGGAIITLGSGISFPTALAVDGNGNIFVTSSGTSIKEIPAGNGATTTIASGLNNPYGVAVDASGNVFFSERGANAIKEIPGGVGGPVTITPGLNSPYNLTIDATGNIYFADFGNNAIKKIVPTGGFYLNSFLPAGIVFSNATGTISGTPLAISPATNYTVTAYNGSGNNSAIVNIKVSVAAIATLSKLSVSTGTLSPVFATGTTSYTASVGNTISSIMITPTATDGNATIKVNGAAVTTATASGALPLNVGPNIITTVVTAQDGITTKTYTVTVTRTASTNANLVNLHLSNGTLSPVFVATTTSYTSAVPNTVTSVTVTGKTSVTTSTLTVNGITVVSGVASTAIPLNIGPNTIDIVVTAENGITTKTYTISVTRAASNIASLVNLHLSNCTLSPVFSAATTNYTAAVVNAVTSITVTPATSASSSSATVTVNGTTVASGTASAGIPLNTGPNAITTTVTAQDGITIKTYTVIVTRAPSTNAILNSIKLNPLSALTLAAGADYKDYTASVNNTTGSVQVIPTAAVTTSSITVNGTAVTSGVASGSISLNVGPNIITTVVTAEDGVSAHTYVITVTRALSPDATLSALTLSSGTLVPTFNPTRVAYTASVANTISGVTLTPTTGNPAAKVNVNGTAVMSGIASGSIPLNVGPNAITTTVTAQDGITTKSYTITITRAPSNNSVLSSIKLNPLSALTVVAGADFKDYTTSVSNATSSVQVIPTTVVTTSTITVNGTMVTSGASSASIPLNVGPTTITTVVTAQDGITTHTYGITVTRAAASMNTVYEPVSVSNPIRHPEMMGEGINVHQGLSPNGDGINDFLLIDGINNYPDNKLQIMNRSGALVFEAKGYDNSTKVFDGHSNKNGAMQLPGTYFYSLDFIANGVTQHKTGFIVLKY